MKFLILISIIIVLCLICRTFARILWFIIKWAGIIIGCLIGAVMIGDVIYGRWLENQHRRNVLYQLDHDLGLGRYDTDKLDKFVKSQR